ncbi:MAG: insulinase family protein [Polyangiaceae bacterium]|nr:insulinase family protein [Polyangiaceae bacterium]
MTREPLVDVARLSNGLRVVLAPGPHLHRTAVACLTQVGARYEDASNAGLSHFLEHMLHRGTPSYPSAHALASQIEGMGASLDAATGVDRGSLVVTTPPENTLDAIEVLGEVLEHPLFCDLEVERGIVHEELLEDRDDRGRLIDPDGIVRSLVFGEHPLGFPIVGTPATLKRFSVPMLRAHHERHYTTETTVVAVAGKLPSRPRLLRTLERAFARRPRGGRLVPAPFRVNPPAATAAAPISITRSHSSQASLRVACVAPGRKDKSAPAAELLIRLVDDGNATRLYERLCDRRGLCYEVSAGYEAYDETGLFDVAAESNEGAITEVLTEVLGMLGDFAKEGPSQAEIDRALARARWQAERSLDQPEHAAENGALGVLADEPLTAFGRAERLARCSRTALRSLARRMFRPDRLRIAVVGSVSRSTAKQLESIAERYASAYPS